MDRATSICRNATLLAALITLLALLCAATDARAQAASASASTNAGSPPKSSLSVAVDPRLSLDPAAVRRAIAAELGVDVVVEDPSASGTLRIVPAAEHRVRVTYESHGRAPVAREITVPRESERAVEVIALLAGNLVRNEAEDILAALRAQRTGHEAAPALGAVDERKGPGSASETPSSERPAKKTGSQEKPSTPPDVHEQRRPHPLRPVHLSLFEPLSFPLASNDDYAVEIGFIFGKVGGLYGVGLGGVATWIERDFEGVLVDGFGGYAGGSGKGAELAGFGNLVGGSFAGVQVGGFGNYAGGSVAGAQLGGFGNYAGRSVDGAQLSGAVNIATERVDGAQASSLVNYTGDLDGLQLAVVNIGTGRVRGVQFGLVNYAEELDGFAFGLVNIAGNGRVQAMTWYSTTMLVNVAAKFNNGSFFSLTSFGYNPENGLHRLSAGLAFGGHVPLGRFFLEADGGYVHDSVLGENVSEQEDFLRYRGLAGVELTEGFAVFGGGGVRHRLPTEGHSVRHDPEAVLGIQLF